ncbi:MAG TPA: TetR/AcrR family transcriptional regulator [Candidatus Kapabacteria bacterium]|nr:TetR/AcrR family transcriptional regulator [Candidatus Kapabacteria bacterium]
MAKHESEEIRKQQILTATAKCIARYGYHETSVDTIAKESKLSKGAIYWYYNSKEEVLVALSEWRWKQNIDYVRVLASGSKTFKQFLKALIDASAHYMKTATYEHRTIHELNAMAMANAALNKVITDNSNELQKIIAGVIRRQIKFGELRKNCRPNESAVFLRCFIDGFAIHAVREDKLLLIRAFRKATDEFYQWLKA